MFAVLRESMPDVPGPDPKPPLGTAEEMCGELEAPGPGPGKMTMPPWIGVATA